MRIEIRWPYATPRQVRAARWRRAFPADRKGAATAFHSPVAEL